MSSRLPRFVWLIEQRLKALQDFDFKRPLTVALSGGRDSVALLKAMVLLQAKYHFPLYAFYVHHGLQAKDYRNQAFYFCKKLCRDWQVIFLSNAFEPLQITGRASELMIFPGTHQETATSEAELRELRLSWLLHAPGSLLMAHHKQDQLETQLLKLLRGLMSPQGLQGMRFVTNYEQKQVIRPLLDVTVEEIQSFVDEHQLHWLEDPTNAEDAYLRNWLRQHWLTPLRSSHNGLEMSLMRSLQILSEHQQLSTEPTLSLKRAEYLSKPFLERRQLLANLLMSAGVRQFRTGQLTEIDRQLQRPQKQGRLAFSAFIIIFTADQVLAESL